MKHTIINLRWGVLSALFAITVFSACNDDLEQISGTSPAPVTGPTLDSVLRANPTDSLYYRLIVRGGQLSLINSRTNFFTLFVPNNNAMKLFINAASGGQVPLAAPDAVFSGFINTVIPPATAASIVQYNTIPQVIRSSSIPNTFPNFFYPTALNPAPTVSPLLRLTTFPTTRNGAWLSTVPITGVDQNAANGVIHHTAFLVTPPQRFMWDRINTDADMTYLKAAIIRADSGVVASQKLQTYLSNIGPNFTVFAPTNTAFRTTLTLAIAQVLINGGVPIPTAIAQATALASTPNVFSNPALYPVLTAQTVKGIVVYHILLNRAFTNNFPTVQTAYPTLLNQGLPTHPGLKLQATFSTTNPFVATATVKDVYNNAPAANIVINTSPLTPDPNGTSDQNFLNGVLHKIDAVLLPQ